MKVGESWPFSEIFFFLFYDMYLMDDRCKVIGCMNVNVLSNPRLCAKHVFGSRVSLPEKSDKSPET